MTSKRMRSGCRRRAVSTTVLPPGSVETAPPSASSLRRSFSPPLLAIVVGAIQLGIGFLALSVPEAFDVPAYGRSAAHVPEFALAFVAGGILQSIAYVAATRWSGIMPAVLVGVGGLPLVAIIGGLWGGEGYWLAPVLSVALAAGALIDVVRSTRRASAGRAEVPSVGALGAVTSLILGVTMLTVPSTLGLPAPSWLHAAQVPLAVALLVAPAILVVGWRIPRGHAAGRRARVGGRDLVPARPPQPGRAAARSGYAPAAPDRARQHG